jgi:HD domain
MGGILVWKGALSSAVASSLTDLGYDLSWISRGERPDRDELQATGSDLAILPAEDTTRAAVEGLRRSAPHIRILASVGGTAKLGRSPGLADAAVPTEADPLLWILTVLTLAPPSDGEDGEADSRKALVRTVHAALRAPASLSNLDPDSGTEPLRQRFLSTFETMLRLLLVDLERGIHGAAGKSFRVAERSRRIAQSLRLSDAEVETAALAGLLHDVGMHIVASLDALSRPGPLEEAEWEAIRAHPRASATIAAPLTGRSPALEAILGHHERLDGSGYPAGRKGEEIPLGARIAAVADTHDALTHPRPHRSAMSPDEALEHMEAEVRDGKLDPDVWGALQVIIDVPEKEGP